MGTDQLSEHETLLAALQSPDWTHVLRAMAAAASWVETVIGGDPRLDEVVRQLVSLASHHKWEIRRTVATIAARTVHPAFEPALAALLRDDNGRVRQAAEQASLRRRDSRHASTLGRQHAERINQTLDDIEVRFGVRGRDAVKRAAEQIANMFARELYHEVIRLLSPLAMSADRLRNHLSATDVSPSVLLGEAERIDQQVTHLRAVLDAMRAYTDQPTLRFQPEPLRELLSEAADVARANDRGDLASSIEIHVPPTLIAEVSRARMVQALTNVLENAIQSYDGARPATPITVRAEALEGRVAIEIVDRGCGMSAEALEDAITLFATSKPSGTGFGLPLAIKIVEAEHGGRIELQSQEGRGTAVRITIPTRR